MNIKKYWPHQLISMSLAIATATPTPTNNINKNIAKITSINQLSKKHIHMMFINGK